MIKTVTQLNILHSNLHMSYRTSKGKIEEALHIGTHNTKIEPLGDFPSAYPSSFAPGAPGDSSSRAAPSPPPARPSTAGPSTSRVHRASKGKKSKLTMIAEGVFACFNMCRQNAQEIRDLKKRLDE